MPDALAWVKTGPRLVTRIGSVPANAGNLFGTTRTDHAPSVPYSSSDGGVSSSLPGQNGHGRPGSDSTGSWLLTRSPGRSARVEEIVTQRPVRGLRRSWLTTPDTTGGPVAARTR